MIKQLQIGGKKSFDDFGLYIATRKISSPTKKSITESVPFSNVVYDFSKINGEIYWEERTLEYSFDIAEVTTEQMEVVKSKVMNWLLNVHDEDIFDPYIGNYHFHGSYAKDSWSEDFGAGTINVTFNVYPYKISNNDNNIVEEIGVSDGLIEGNYDIVGLKINGKSKQETRSGENKFNINEVSSVVWGSISNKVIMSNVNTNESYGNLLRINCEKAFDIKVGQSYYVSFDLKLVSGSIKRINSIELQNNEFSSVLRGSQIISNPTPTSEYQRYIFLGTLNLEGAMSLYIQSYKTEECIVEIENIMISSKNLEYEEYGVSPSPDYPSEIESVGTYNEEVGKYEVEIKVTNGADTNTTALKLNEPLRSLSNEIYDTLKNDVITRKVGCIILNGSENWSVSTSYEGFYRYYITLDKLYSSTSYGVVGINTHFKQRIYELHGGYEYLYVQGSEKSGNLYIQSATLSTINELKEWLSANNVTVLYELAEPMIETINFPSIPTYENETNIIVNTNLETTYEVYYNEVKNITITNNSSHRIAPKIISEGNFTITLNDQSYSVGEGTFNNGFYLETGENKLTITGYGKITFSYKEEMF